jgi:hypothetical protein
MKAFEKTFLKTVDYVSKNEKKIYFFAGAFLIIILALVALDLLNVKKIFGFLTFLIVGASFKYLITKYRVWVEFTPIAFFCVLISRLFGSYSLEVKVTNVAVQVLIPTTA